MARSGGSGARRGRPHSLSQSSRHAGARDRPGRPARRWSLLPPFIDVEDWPDGPREASGGAARLLAVAMMRRGRQARLLRDAGGGARHGALRRAGASTSSATGPHAPRSRRCSPVSARKCASAGSSKDATSSAALYAVERPPRLAGGQRGVRHGDPRGGVQWLPRPRRSGRAACLRSCAEGRPAGSSPPGDAAAFAAAAGGAPRGAGRAAAASASARAAPHASDTRWRQRPHGYGTPCDPWPADGAFRVVSRSILIAVTHLLGVGHLSRAAALGRGLARAGRACTLVSGGRAAPTVDTSGLDLRPAPGRALPRRRFHAAAAATTARRSALSLRQARIARLLRALEESDPDDRRDRDLSARPPPARPTSSGRSSKPHAARPSRPADPRLDPRHPQPAFQTPTRRRGGNEILGALV